MEDESNIDNTGPTSVPSVDSGESFVPNQVYQSAPIQSPIAHTGSSVPSLQNEVKPKYRLIIILPILISMLVAILAVLYYFVIFVPGKEAKIFVSEVSKDFESVVNSVRKVGSDQGNSNSLEISKGYFFEIPNLRAYSESKLDTAQNVISIKDTILKIDAVIEHKTNLHTPLTVEDLNTKADRYYGDLKSAMNNLLDYENFQLKILGAQGDEYNSQLEEFADMSKAGVNRTVLVAYFAKLVELGDASLGRLKNIGAAPKDENNFYHFVVDSDQDRTDSARKALAYMTVGDARSDLLSVKVMQDYQDRQEVRNINNKNDIDAILKSSQLKAAFDKALFQEESFKEGLSSYYKKYGMEQPWSDTLLESTGSAAPLNTSSSTPQPAQ